MRTTLTVGGASAHQNRLPEHFRRALSADLKKVQRQQWQKDGAAIAVAISLARLTRKEAAARLVLSESNLSMQIAGTERPQTERFENDDLLAGPIAVAKALQHPDVFEVKWTITAKVAA